MKYVFKITGFICIFTCITFHTYTIFLLCFLQEIQSLLTNWKGPDLIGYGELVLEGTFRLQRAKNERTLFLFDKLLLITKKREETYTYKAHILVSRAASSDPKIRQDNKCFFPVKYFNTTSYMSVFCCCCLFFAVLQSDAGGSYS